MNASGTARYRPSLARLAAVLAVTAALPIAACGDEESSGGGGGESASAGDASGIVAEAQQMIDDAREPLEFKAPGPAIDVTELRGKTVAIVSVDQRVPILSIANRALEEAAKEVGINTTLTDAKSEVTRMQQGIETAARDADAVILTGIPIAAVPAALEKAKDIPSVSVLNNQPKAGEPGQGAGELVFASSAPDYEHGGALVAAKAIVDTKGELVAEIFDTKEITPSPDVIRGMKSLLDKCSTCTVTENTTPLAEWATALTPKAQTVIRSNPELNYMLPIFDDMGIFLTAGIRQAGAADKVKVAALDGTPAALQLIQEDDVFSANPGQPTGWLGWHALDQAMRGMLGEEPGDPVIPNRLLDDSNLEGVDVEDIDAPYGDPQYKEGFRELWGLGG